MNPWQHISCDIANKEVGIEYGAIPQLSFWIFKGTKVMTSVVLWKEYRQQRALWLALALGAVLFAILLGTTLGQGNGLQMFHQDPLRGTLLTVVFAFAMGYGIVSGALLLAGESDDGTVFYLDALAGRGELWKRKCLAGLLLTLALSVALIALSLGLGFASLPIALLMPMLALEAFAWGLLGGALCQRVLTAVLTGIALLAGSWVVFMACGWLFVPILWGDSPFWFSLAKAGAAVTAGYVSFRRYAAVDRLRQPDSMRPPARKFSLLPASVRVLVYLIVRQGAWALAVCVVLTIVVASTVKFAAFAIWPIGTLLLGLICGLSTFLHDQPDGVRYLSAQRFPPGRIWIVKIGFWALIPLVLTFIAWYVHGLMRLADSPGQQLFSEWMSMGLRDHILNPLIFLGIWPVYGFCFGLFSAQTMPRPVIAVILAFILAPLVVLWVPSYLMGGLPLWQVLVVPVLLLLLTRLNQRAWLSGRLLTGKPLLFLLTGTGMVLLSLACSLWYRVLEIPDVGEPFDVQAFEASLPTPEQNEAGPLLRRAGRDMREHLDKVTRELPPPMQPLFPEDKAPPATQTQKTVLDYTLFLWEIELKGWPKQDQEMVRWLDRVFAGDWVAEVEKAARLPLGMFQDPRQRYDKVDVRNVYGDYRVLTGLLRVRAMQLQVHGDPRAALKQLQTALALTRQMKNFAANLWLYNAYQFEADAMDGYRFWLVNAPRDKALLRDALAMLQRHEAASPKPENSIKAQYLSFINNDPKFTHDSDWVNELLALSFQVPWEKERQHRLANALIAGQLRASKQPYCENPGQKAWGRDAKDRELAEALSIGLPPPDGPGSNLSAATWGELLVQFNLNHPQSHFWLSTNEYAVRMLILHAAELTTALALYQVDHGTPATVDVVVPEYLPALPDDPFSGRPLSYWVSKGENLPVTYPPITLVPGQGIVSGPRPLAYFPLPFWQK